MFDDKVNGGIESDAIRGVVSRSKRDESYFTEYSDESIAKLCLEQLKYNKIKKNSSPNRIGGDQSFFQDLQAEIVQRFVTKYK